MQWNGASNGRKSKGKPLAFIGKGVTFDSGGDVWVKDLSNGELVRVSQPDGDPGAEPSAPAYADAVTSSGLVVFTSATGENKTTKPLTQVTLIC